MVKYIGKRIFTSILTIWVVVTLTFFLMRAMPGGPFTGEKMTPEIKANLEEKYGLDKSLGQQYGMYMKNLLKGDLGVSMIFKGREVVDTIKTSLPASAKVGGAAIMFSVVLGVLLGIISALKIGKWQDKLCMLIATLGVTIPSFVIGATLIYIFTVELRLLPATGLSSWKNYIMPVIALSGSSLAFITRLTRSRMLDVLKADYIRTAKAKGLSKKTVVFKHALRNSLIPIVTYLGPLIAGVLTGSFIVEKVFGIPGLGNEFVSSVTNRDYSTVLGLVVFYCTFIIICNLVVDILYVVIDPRIKLENTEG
ncbi:ABC transporter permease [Clostridium gasigenes]|uniref:ABC transporter permease n=1 Tax=Clostridium gasigenes TaxID=94869 RepID=A0A1H0UG48_9CLOT|nr:ABC transporter permease [Clostridium gasigenes]MBB6621869.1 ABC transporter permease [Clostridium gasigenes]MBB6716777.1 ABC transporter permease [Clostridium gasigenes]MBU3089723.1 ABC transporter permease [Clostridium gasigenes]NKF08357.1 ABC transporter permease [Clostridium gasigenes]QSW18678.1 ABC transporter permease [Clostridium gasigenes]